MWVAAAGGKICLLSTSSGLLWLVSFKANVAPVNLEALTSSLTTDIWIP